MSARTRASSDDQRIGLRLAGRLKKRVLNGTGGNANRRFGTDGPLKISYTPKRFPLFNRFELDLKVQPNPESRLSGLDRVHDGKFAVRHLSQPAGKAKHPF
jgi:hypothetical protein